MDPKTTQYITATIVVVIILVILFEYAKKSKPNSKWHKALNKVCGCGKQNCACKKSSLYDSNAPITDVAISAAASKEGYWDGHEPDQCTGSKKFGSKYLEYRYGEPMFQNMTRKGVARADKYRNVHKAEQQTTKEHMVGDATQAGDEYDFMDYIRRSQITPDMAKNHKSFVQDEHYYARQPAMPDQGIEASYYSWQGLPRVSLIKKRAGERQTEGVSLTDLAKGPASWKWAFG